MLRMPHTQSTHSQQLHGHMHFCSSWAASQLSITHNVQLGVLLSACCLSNLQANQLSGAW
jgi:hypothetical protein